MRLIDVGGKMKLTLRQLWQIIKESLEVDNDLVEEELQARQFANLILSPDKENHRQALELVDTLGYGIGYLNKMYGVYLKSVMKKLTNAVMLTNPQSSIVEGLQIIPNPRIVAYKIDKDTRQSYQIRNPTGADDENVMIGGGVKAVFTTNNNYNEEHIDLDIYFDYGKVKWELSSYYFSGPGRDRPRSRIEKGIDKYVTFSEEETIQNAAELLAGKL